MPDIFDNIPAAAKPTADVFDQVHSQIQGADENADKAELEEPTGPAKADPSVGFNQANLRNQTAQANAFEQARQRQSAINAQGPLKNAWNAFAAGTSNLIGKGSAQIVDYMGNNAGDYDTDQEAADFSTVHKDMADVQQYSDKTFPNDPNRMSGKVGHAASAVAPSLLATATGNPELVPAIMAAQGMENAQENIDAVQSAGGEVSHGQAVTNTLAQGGLGALLGYAAPGGTASKALIGTLPKLANPLLNAGKNALVAGAVAAPEMGLYQAGSNAINMATGTETPEQQAQPWQTRISEGVPEASAQGLAFGGGGQALHEGLSALTSKLHAQPAPAPAEAKTADVFDKAAGQSDVPQVPPKESARVQEYRRLQQWARDNGQPVPELTPELHPEETEAGSIKPNEKAQFEDRPAEQPYDFAALRKRVADSQWRNVPEKGAAPAEADDTAAKAVLAEGGHTFEQPTESEPATDKRLADRRITQAAIDPAAERRVADDRRFEEQAKGAQFQTPEEAAPNLLAEMRANQGEAAEPKPSETIREHAAAYGEKSGIAHGGDTVYTKVDMERAKRIAAAYDAMQHDPTDPDVKKSYDALKAETYAQYQHLKDAGYKFTGTEGQGYANSAAMHDDLANNKHLSVFTGGDMPADHPLAEAAPKNDDGLKTYNDIFRAVHDVFGHGKEGYGFGPRGEENAWRQHSQMYSDSARPAMTAETRGQNSWVNYGPKGEANRADPSKTTYAEQKAGMLPQEFERLGDEQKPNVFKRLASDEAAVDTGTEAFVKQDVIPTINNIASGLKEATTGLRHTFGLQEGKDAQTTKDIMKLRGSELAQRSDQVADQFNKAEKTVGKLSTAEQLAITHAAETGQQQANPAMQSIADAIRGEYDDRLAQIQKRDPKFQGIEDYMAHDWKDPRKAGPIIADALRKRPLAGEGGFRKQRVFMTQEEGIAAGLEPKSTNPVEQMRNKLHSMDRWITAFDAKESMDQAGLLKDEPAKGRLPDGYSKVNDPMFKGKMVPDAVASVLNNVLTPGIAGHPQFGAAFRGVRTVANMMNEAQLSLSGFHAVTTSINSAISEFALGLKQAVEGKPLAGLKRMGMGLTGVGPAARDFFGGTKMLKEWLHPGTTDPETSIIVNAMKEQGGRATMDSYDRSGMTGKMFDAFKNGNPLGGILRAPFAAIEQTAKPIMKYMVPRLKMGAFMQAAQAALEAHPGSTAEELSGHMGDAWQSIDNRFGQMVHDNRFWTQTMRHLSHMTFRSVGWNFGTLDEMGGGALDFARAGKDLTSGKGADFTHRMAYTVALPTLIGTWGAVLGYAMTGNAPQSIKDLYYPKTGAKDKDGRDVRIALPTYMRDVFSAKHDWTGTVGSKLHPLIGTTLDFLANKDFQGNKVYNEDDKGQDIIKDVAKHFGKSFLPINLQQWASNKQSGSNDTGSSIRTQLGVANAPKWTSTTDAEQEAYKQIDEKNNKVGGRTKEAAALRENEQNWVQEIRTGKKDQAVTEMKADPQMNQMRAKSVFRRASEKQGLVGLVSDSQLQAPELLKVWGKATDEEKGAIKEAMGKRLSDAGNRLSSMSPNDRDGWKKLYDTVRGAK